MARLRSHRYSARSPHGDADILRHDPIDRVVGGRVAQAIKVDVQVRGVNIGRWAEQRLGQDIVTLGPKRIGIHMNRLAVIKIVRHVGIDIRDLLFRKIDIVRQVLRQDNQFSLDPLELDEVLEIHLVVAQRVALQVNIVALGVVEVQVGGGWVVTQRALALHIAPDGQDVGAEGQVLRKRDRDLAIATGDGEKRLLVDERARRRVGQGVIERRDILLEGQVVGLTRLHPEMLRPVDVEIVLIFHTDPHLQGRTLRDLVANASGKRRTKGQHHDIC